jgi:excisionase family DNA binding protein
MLILMQGGFMTKEKAVTAVEAARRLGVGLDYVYGLLWTGKLQGRRVNGRWQISAEAVDERRARIGERSRLNEGEQREAVAT